MIGPLHSILRDRTGVSAIEFGILAPVLFAMVFGAIEYGRMFYVRQGMENAVEQGARYYMLNPSATQAAVTSQISAAMVGGMGGQLSVSYTDTANCNSQSALTCTTITVTYPFHFVAGILNAADKTLTATSRTTRWN